MAEGQTEEGLLDRGEIIKALRLRIPGLVTAEAYKLTPFSHGTLVDMEKGLIDVPDEAFESIVNAYAAKQAEVQGALAEAVQE